MIENVFDTLEQAELAAEYDYQLKKEADKLTMPDWESYYEGTLQWATPRLRKDGKYAYPVCPVSDGVYTTEEYNPDHYESGDMEVYE